MIDLKMSVLYTLSHGDLLNLSIEFYLKSIDSNRSILLSLGSHRALNEKLLKMTDCLEKPDVARNMFTNKHLYESFVWIVTRDV